MTVPDTPYTRDEMYLSAIADGDSSGIPDRPYTRKEKYLDAIATGDSSGIPENPYTREEMYLDAIARGGGGGGGGSTLINKSVDANGTYNASDDNADGYKKVTVNVPNSYAEGDEGKVVSNGALVSQTAHAEVNQNGTIDTTLNDSVVVNVPTGGGVTPAPVKDVNFIDYDGTIVYSYTAQEAQALESLPANPSHDGLTAQGWNWTLAQIKAQLTNVGSPVWVGQMYITQSGDTEIDLRFADAARLSPILTIAVDGEVTVDWGDNTTPDTVTGSSLTTRQDVPHTYAAPGDYMMKIHVVSGSFTFYGSTSYTILRKNTTDNENRLYANCVQAVRLGNGVTSIGSNAFYSCFSLASITIPSGVTSIGNSAFQYCCSLASITIPSSVTSIGSSAFYYCYGMASITIPIGVTSIGINTFYYCYSLASITIPSGVTSIGNSAFNYCYSLASIIIPSDVTSIGNSAFATCYGVAEYHIKPTSVPTGGITMFNNIVSDCVIYVPRAKINDYKTATNWGTYASYMQGE